MIVYIVTNTKNGKVYIGYTINTIKRKQCEYRCRANRGDQNRFVNAFRNYGFLNFEWAILKECDSQEELIIYREYFISIYNSMDIQHGYNCTDGAKHFTFSKEVLEVMRINNTGETNPNYGLGLKGEKCPAFGKKHSKKTLKKMSRSQLERYAKHPCPSGKSHWSYGVPALGGKDHYNYGKHLSVETRQKIRLALKKYWKNKKST